VCATGETASENAAYGRYTFKETRALQSALVPELGDTTLVFEPLSGAARLAESRGRGLRVWPDTLARLASAAASGERIELEIYEAPLTLWDRVFFCRRRFSRGCAASTATRDFDDERRSSTGSTSSSSSSDDVFAGKGGTFGGAGASGSWDAASTGAAIATGAALGAGVAAASESSSSSEADTSSGTDDGSSSDDTSSSDDGSSDDAGTSY
jgi:hypothetical protein